MKFLFFVISVCLIPLNAMAATDISVQLKWYHQAQFAGCYVAQEKNFYKDGGLNVTFIEGGPGVNPAASLSSAKAAFAIASPEDLLQRQSHGEKIKAIASIYRKSAVVFLSRKGSAILRPKDFTGKTIAVKSNQGISDFEFQFYAMMKNVNVNISGMTVVPYDPLYKGLIDGRIDITPAYFTGGLIKLNAKGINVNIIYPGDYRVRFYSDTLLTTDKLIKSHSNIVYRFVEATLKGWAYALANIEESLPYILKYARVKDADLQKRMLEAAFPLIQTGEYHLGWMTLDEWRHMYDILFDQGIITTPIRDLNDVFTNRFVAKMNDR